MFLSKVYTVQDFVWILTRLSQFVYIPVFMLISHKVVANNTGCLYTVYIEIRHQGCTFYMQIVLL